MDRLKLTLVLGIAFATASCQQNAIDTADGQSWAKLHQQVVYARKTDDDVANVLPAAQRAYELAEETFGSTDERTLRSLALLASLHNSNGQLGNAERFYLKAVRLRESVLDTAFPEPIENKKNLSRLNTIRNRLAVIYLSVELFDRARPIIEKAWQSQSETLGESHPDTLVSLGTLANLHFRQENYDEAVALLSKIIRITEERLEKSAPKLPVMSEGSLLHYKQKLAEAYSAEGRNQEAEKLHQQVLIQRTERFGETHRSALQSMGKLAVVYHRQGRYSEALTLFEKTVAQRREVIGPFDPETFSGELGSVYGLIKLGRLDEAIAQLSESSRKRLIYTKGELASASGAIRRSTVLGLQGIFQNVALSFAIETQTAKSVELAGKMMLDWKQIEGPETAFLAHQIRSTDSEDIRRLALEVKELRIRLTKLAQESDQQKQLLSVLDELEAKEFDLANATNRLEQTAASVDKIEQALPPKSAVIEFRKYRSADFNTFKQGDAYFAVLLLQRNRDPKLVTTGKVSDISKHLETIHNDHVSARSKRAASALYNLLFSGLADDLNGIEKLYIAPDGILHLLPFDRLILSDGKYLGERTALRIVPTSRELLNPENSEAGSGLLAIGGVDFDNVDQEPIITSNEAGSLVASSRSPLDLSGLEPVRGQVRGIFEDFDPLPASQDEVDRIAQIYREKQPDTPISVWTGASASEARLKSLNEREEPPRILHIATHGFYLPKQFQSLSRPHLYSGLVLAGANQSLREGHLDAKVASDDGILYSLEAQDLDLDGTELVVLSACDTAKGVIDYSDGVVGMVQSLRIAGAKRILTTLWPVLDKPTAAFMEMFYKNWLNDAGEDVAAALDLTKKMFREHQNPDYRSPKIWAPFVLIGT